MAFPMDELDSARRPDAAGVGPALLGDIVLCPAVAKDQAAQAGHGLLDELHLLTVHGVLHLLGLRPRRAGRGARDVRACRTESWPSTSAPTWPTGAGSRSARTPAAGARRSGRDARAGRPDNRRQPS